MLAHLKTYPVTKIFRSICDWETIEKMKNEDKQTYSVMLLKLILKQNEGNQDERTDKSTRSPKYSNSSFPDVLGGGGRFGSLSENQTL